MYKLTEKRLIFSDFSSWLKCKIRGSVFVQNDGPPGEGDHVVNLHKKYPGAFYNFVEKFWGECTGSPLSYTVAGKLRE